MDTAMPWHPHLRAEIEALFRPLSTCPVDFEEMVYRMRNHRGRWYDRRLETQAKRQRDREITRELRRQRASYPRWQPPAPSPRPDLEQHRAALSARHRENRGAR